MAKIRRLLPFAAIIATLVGCAEAAPEMTPYQEPKVFVSDIIKEAQEKEKVQPEIIFVEAGISDEELYLAVSNKKMEKIEYLKEEDLEQYYTEYMKIVEDYKEWVDPPETIYDIYTDEEIQLICRVVETETYQCSFEAKANVATVVMNRVEYDGFGDNVKTVVTSPNQFVYSRTAISDDTIKAVEYAFMFPTPVDNALYFQSGGYKERFSGAVLVHYDGYHWFYSKEDKKEDE